MDGGHPQSRIYSCKVDGSDLRLVWPKKRRRVAWMYYFIMGWGLGVLLSRLISWPI